MRAPWRPLENTACKPPAASLYRMQEAAPAYRGFEIERHEMTIRTATAAEIRAYWREREAACRIHRDGRVSFRPARNPAIEAVEAARDSGDEGDV